MAFKWYQTIIKYDVSGSDIMNYGQIIDRLTARAQNILFFSTLRKSFKFFWVIFVIFLRFWALYK